ncbi:MAG: O-antigen ligase family protein [Clostridia bacterium]|nr:O-antigen ligase family protein [Clostridia bacterium]
MKNFIKTYFDFSKNENFVYLTAAAVFLPYPLAILLLLIMSVYILAKKNIKKEVFCHTGSFLIVVFSAFTAVTALCYKNYLGLMVSALFFLIFVVAFYIRSVMTTELFEKMLSLCCRFSIFASGVVLFEKIIYFNSKTHRCYGDFFGNKLTSFYFSPTYLASCMAVVVLICAYKVINRKGNKKYYYLIAILSMLTMYFGGSMFIWVNVFAGLAVYLFLSRHHKLLGLLFVLVTLGGVTLFFVPNILPRLSESMLTSDNRMLIWNLSVESIPQSIFTGRGFQSYGLIALNLIKQGADGVYSAYHSHNIILECLLSFGIIGSTIILAFMFTFFQKILICSHVLKRSHISILIMAVASGVLVHSIIDMPMLWVQTMLLYGLIFSGLGADEKRISRIFKRLKNSNISEVK